MPEDKPLINARAGGEYGNKLLEHYLDVFRRTLRAVLANRLQDGYMVGTVPPKPAEERAFLEASLPQIRLAANQGDPDAQRMLVRWEELK